MRPNIPGSPVIYKLQTTPDSTDGPSPITPTVNVTRPSLTSTSSSLTSSMDEDFFRLARSRSNPDILRSTLGRDVVTHPSLDLVQQHADPLSRGTTPSGSTENLLRQ